MADVDVAGPVDAGPSTTTQKPIADIELVSQGLCGTSVKVSASGSRAFDGATVTSYKWTMRTGGGQVIDTFVGPASKRLPLGLHRYGGDLLNPHVNFPAYDGDFAMRAVVDQIARTNIFQKGVDLGLDPQNETFRVFFAVGLEASVDTSEGVNVKAMLVSQDNATIVERTFTGVPGRFSGHETDFDLSTVPGTVELEEVRLEFRFEGSGRRWLDNVALVNQTSGIPVTLNRSVVDGDEGEWKLGNGGFDFAGLDGREIAAVMRDEEQYKLALEVTDSNGAVSDVDEFLVSGGACN